MASGSVAITPFVNYGSYVDNLNTLFNSGCGYTNEATGQPYTQNGMVMVFNAGAIVMQLFMPYQVSASNPVVYRVYSSGAWTSWTGIA